MTEEKTAPERPAVSKLVVLIGVAIIFVAAAIYVTERLAGNGEDGPASVSSQKLLETVAPLAVGDVAALAVGDEVEAVPDINFIDGQGAAKTLDDWQGRLVLLNLWATWCAPCLKEMPALDRLQARLGSERFEVVTINVDKGGPAKGIAFFEQVELQNLTYFYDNSSEKIFRQIRAFGMPTTILVDYHGREVARMAGPAEWDSEDAVALIEAALEVQ